MKQKVYISGQVTGLSKKEYMARFEKAEELLRDNGYNVVNPTKFFVSRWDWLYNLLGYNLVLLYDIWRLSKCDLIYKIPGWRESKGANVEGCWAYHYDIFYLPKKLRERIDKKMCKWMDRFGLPSPVDTLSRKPKDTLRSETDDETH